MELVEEIEAAISTLPPDEFSRIGRWVHERDQALRDRQLDADSRLHKLDFLFDEAADEPRREHIRVWPPARRNPPQPADSGNYSTVCRRTFRISR